MKIAVLRFSSLGDVAMIVPVLQNLLTQHPQVELVIISRPSFQSLFQHLPRTKFLGFDIDNEYKKTIQLLQIAKAIKQQKPNAIADLHNVLRTKIIKSYFLFSSIPIKTLNKGRKEKKLLTQKTSKNLYALESMHQRYAKVFNDLGFKVNIETKAIPIRVIKNIGLAPFAKYQEKMLPLPKSQELAETLAKQGYKVYLYGGKQEQTILENWKKTHENIHSLAGKMSLAEELQSIKKLDIMISMDSANMHLASMFGVRVLSIWGATHPYLGFLGYNQSFHDTIQINDLACRPCSVFGNKKCYRGDLACMNRISINTILDKINS